MCARIFKLICIWVFVALWGGRDSSAGTSVIGCITDDLSDPFAEMNRVWLKAEQTLNNPEFRKPPEDVVIRGVLRPKSEFEIISTSPEGDAFLKMISNGDSIYWLVHPDNTDMRVPFTGDPNLTPVLTGRYTSSRSIAFVKDGMWGSVKLPTNRPHGKGGQKEPQKVNIKTYKDAQLTAYYRGIDSHLVQPQSVILVPEPLTIVHKASGKGMIFRDLNSFKDGNEHIPAYGIPWMNEPSSQFWIENYVKKMARAQGEMFLRYGISHINPHPQNNILLRKDGRFQPRLKIRDMTDEVVNKTIFERAIKPLYGNQVLPENVFSNQSGIHIHFITWNLGLKEFELKQWAHAYYNEFLNYVGAELGQNFNSLEDWERFLQSDAGIEAIKRWHLRNQKSKR